jgi:hypothetical protein
MAKLQTVVTLQSKRDEIIASFTRYEKQVAQARADLAHINAMIRVFEASGDPKDMPRYVNLHRQPVEEPVLDIRGELELSVGGNGNMFAVLIEGACRIREFGRRDDVAFAGRFEEGAGSCVPGKRERGGEGPSPTAPRIRRARTTLTSQSRQEPAKILPRSPQAASKNR